MVGFQNIFYFKIIFLIFKINNKNNLRTHKNLIWDKENQSLNFFKNIFKT